MKFRNRSDFIFTFLLSVFVLYIMLNSLRYSHSLRLVPLIIATPTLTCLIAIMIQQSFIRTTKSPKKQDLTEPNIFRIVCWIITFSISLFIFGFIASIPIFSFASLLVEARVRWHISLIATFIISLAIQYIFNFYLQVNLWPGMIPEIIPGILGGGVLPPI